MLCTEARNRRNITLLRQSIEHDLCGSRLVLGNAHRSFGYPHQLCVQPTQRRLAGATWQCQYRSHPRGGGKRCRYKLCTHHVV